MYFLRYPNLTMGVGPFRTEDEALGYAIRYPTSILPDAIIGLSSGENIRRTDTVRSMSLLMANGSRRKKILENQEKVSRIFGHYFEATVNRKGAKA